MMGFALLEISVIAVLVLCCYAARGKECTNIPTQLSSHTFRSELLASNNQTWKDEMFFYYHLTPTDESAWVNLLPRKVLGEDSDELYWTMIYRKMKNGGNRFDPSNAGGESFLKEVSLHDVRLGKDSLHWRAQQTNLEYLLMLETDRLVWSFRKTAGLPTPGQAYGGWESPTTELRGHFVGHYLSASALMWASTHNNTLKEKMYAVVSALSECQDKMNTGYLSAFPSELFDRFEAIQPVWAPYYTIHKIMAGLLDQYSFVGVAQALKMVKLMADYFYTRVKNVILTKTIEQHWRSLNEETGGMNDVLYRLYNITGDPKHLLLAHLFDKPCFLGLLAVEADGLSGFHANTHIPIVIGSQLRYEITGDSLYKEVATFFMNIVNSSHIYATGGTSVDEFWSNPRRLASALVSETEESCTTYNMLKVSRHLFAWTKEVAYADYYERALTNGVLSIQRGTEPGKMIYMLPLARGASKARSTHGWGTFNNSFWCCYGTGIESFSKLGDSIYFEDKGQEPRLYVIQYISSSFEWKSAQILLDQKANLVTSADPVLRVAFTFSSKAANRSATLNLRIPSWSSSVGAAAELNGHNFTLMLPGNFHSISVKPGDKLMLHLPITLRTEAIKDDRPEFGSLQAILYGPYLLAGLTSGDWDIRTGSAASPSDWITPIPTSYNSDLISLFHDAGPTTFVVTNSNRSITMEASPGLGTDGSVHATFRLVLREDGRVGRRVMLEPFDLPGMAVVPLGPDGGLVVGDSAGGNGSAVFRLVSGNNGKNGTVSLESEGREGCFVYSGVNYGAGQRVKVACRGDGDAATAVFAQATSFVSVKGLHEYWPISFAATGAGRNFVLSPLLSLRDESYTVYFNVQA